MNPGLSVWRIALGAGAAIALTAAATKDLPKVPKNSLRPEQRAAHLLDRLGYGPRPGDVERLIEGGEAAFIERQLNPDGIDDRALEERLSGLETLKMSTAELTQLFPNPGIVQRMVQQGLIDESLIPRRFRPDPAAGPPAGPGAGPAAGPAMQGMMGGRGPIDPLHWKIQRLEEPISPPRRGMLQAPPILGLNPQFVVSSQLQAAKLLRAVYSERQLLEAMTDFWMNHFNVFIGKNQVRLLVNEYEREAIRPNAFGKFRDLLGAVAKSPAMLAYLDNAQSISPDSMIGRRRKAGLNENYARELLELHTLGVDGGYTQTDVTETARILTGWTALGGDPRRMMQQGFGGRGQRQPAQSPRARGPQFNFLAPAHDPGVKRVLAKTFEPAGQQEGERLLDMLAQHPSTARFLAMKLVRRFVADEPPAKLVAETAKTYQRTGGDIREMLRTIFYSKQFWSDEAYRDKVKKPLDLVASSIRATGADFAPSMQVLQTLQRMGEPLYQCQPPTGYPESSDAWLGSDALVTRWNFALGVANGRVPGVGRPRIDVPEGLSREAVLDHLANELLQGPLPVESREKLLATARGADAGMMGALILGSPEFQRR